MIEALRQRVQENPRVFALVAVIICFAIGFGFGRLARNVVNEAEAGQIHHPEVRDEKWREIIAAESNGHIPTSMPNVERKRGKISTDFISEGPI